MKLAIFTNQFPGKVSTFFARDVAGLLAAGIDVDVFSIYPESPELWQFVPDSLSAAVLPRQKVRHLSLTDGFLQLHRAAASPAVRSQMRRILASASRFGCMPVAKSAYVLAKACAWSQCGLPRYDHIFSYWGNYAATCADLYRTMTCPETPFSLLLHAGTDLYRDQVYLREKLIRATNIFVVCEFNRDFLRRLYPDLVPAIDDRIHLHHLGLDLKQFPFLTDARCDHLILGVGTLTRRKGFANLIQALHQLRANGLPAHLELIGDGEQRKVLERLVAKLQITPQVVFRGWLNETEVREAMARACVLVHPSSGLGDAVPTVIKECMALGTPVVASRVAGVPELLDEGRAGLLVPPNDVPALSAAIAQLLRHPHIRRGYATVARSRAESLFDVWTNTRRLADLLQDTAHASPANHRRAGANGFTEPPLWQHSPSQSTILQIPSQQNGLRENDSHSPSSMTPTGAPSIRRGRSTTF